MTALIDTLKTELVNAIKSDRLTLPTLPEVALQVREAAHDPDASVATLSEVLSTDAALTARVIKVANSPLLRGPQPIEDVKMAVSRLGLDYTANLATGLAMEQMFQATSDIVDERMRDVWAKSTEIAGIAHVLCKHYAPKLKPAQATLAGLVHKIGVLPILKFAEEQHTELLDDPATLDMIINDLGPAVGTLILRTWAFPAAISCVPKECTTFSRTIDEVDYADLVMVSILQSVHGTDHPYTRMDWKKISAFQRVGIDPEMSDDDEEDLTAQMEAAMAMLQG